MSKILFYKLNLCSYNLNKQWTWKLLKLGLVENLSCNHNYLPKLTLCNGIQTFYTYRPRPTIPDSKYFPKVCPTFSRPMSLLEFHRSSLGLYCHYGNQLSNRFYCSDGKNKNTRPSLDDGSVLLEKHPMIIWPSFLQMLRNLILTVFIIRPFYDSSFKIISFLNASVEAVCKVSEDMSTGNFEALTDLMDRRTLHDFKEIYKSLSTKERMTLKIIPDDIIARTLLMIGLIFEEPKDENSQQKVFMEITTCYHVCHGFREVISNKKSTFSQIIDPSDNLVVNFRFYREITKGVDDQYTINSLNYMKPVKAVN